jgi:cation:H+ antiporter
VWWAGALVVVLSAVMFYLSSKLTEVEGGKGFNYMVYPWVTTLPETLASTLLLIKGLHTASLYNSIFSAVFDLCVVIGLTAIIYGVVEIRGLIDMALITALGGFLFLFLAFDRIITSTDAVILYTVLIVSMVYGYFIGLGKPRISWSVVAVGLALSTVACYLLVEGIDLLCKYIPEAYGGVISAVATSIPDIIIALLYGLRTEEAVASLYGCIIHDYVENIATAVLVASLAGVPGLVVADVVATAVAVAVTALLIVLTTSYGRITRFEGVILLSAFVALLVLV